MPPATFARCSPLSLTGEPWETLEYWVRGRKTAQAPTLRAGLVLLSAQRKSNQDLAARLDIAQ